MERCVVMIFTGCCVYINYDVGVDHHLHASQSRYDDHAKLKYTYIQLSEDQNNIYWIQLIWTWMTVLLFLYFNEHA